MWSNICDIMKLNKNKAIKQIKRSNFITNLPRVHRLSGGSFMVYAFGWEFYWGRR